MFDYIEKRRLQYQQLRVLYDDSVNYTKKDLLVTSKYDNKKERINEDLATPLPAQIIGGASYFRSVISNLKSFVEFNGRPHLFLTFSVDETSVLVDFTMNGKWESIY